MKNLKFFSFLLTLTLAACGGGSGSDNSPGTLTGGVSSSSLSSSTVSSSSAVSSILAVSSLAASSAPASLSSIMSSLVASSIRSSSISSAASSIRSSSSSSDSNLVSAISVSGNKILFGGQEGSIAGMSLFWSNDGWGGEKYYTANTISWTKQDWNIKLIRAAMGVEDGGGYIGSPTNNKNRVKAVVDAALANNLYVIIDWHSHNAHQYQTQAIEFFKEMATLYGENNNVIYEIYNEPFGVADAKPVQTSSANIWKNLIKPYAEAVIAEIRKIDPDNLIIVGTPTWSQDVDVAANNPITGANIAYTLHFYAGTHGESLRDKATTALNSGIALFVTEWGTVEASGNGAVATTETNSWVDFMKSNKISHANWALNDKAEGASALKPGTSATGNWVDSDLTASGTLVKDLVKNW